MTTLHADPRDIPSFILRAVNYNGRHITLSPTTEPVHIPSTDGTWDHGSRTLWFALNLETATARSLVDTHSPPWSPSRTNVDIAPQPGILLIKHRTNQGKDMGVTLYVHPDNLSQVHLPPPTPPLTPVQLLVLFATRRYVSSYNGKDRYALVKSDIHIHNPAWFPPSLSFPTRTEWEAAKSTLIELKLLNKAGAITTAGKNAAQAL